MCSPGKRWMYATLRLSTMIYASEQAQHFGRRDPYRWLVTRSCVYSPRSSLLHHVSRKSVHYTVACLLIHSGDAMNPYHKLEAWEGAEVAFVIETADTEALEPHTITETIRRPDWLLWE
jgi:hypothetical protein